MMPGAARPLGDEAVATGDDRMPHGTRALFTEVATHFLLLAASVFALPSRDEGLPMSLLEAMAYGLPAVVSPVGGIPDVFEDGRHGYFVQPDDPDALADRLRALLENPELARTMGARARADAIARYDVDVVTARLGDALELVLEGSR